ncbi:S8 family serine peptidase [Colwelliaceae bacterium 6441]
MKIKVATAITAAVLSMSILSASAEFINDNALVHTVKSVEATSMNKSHRYNKKHTQKIIPDKNLNTKTSTYIIRLTDMPIATYNGNIKGLEATNPQIVKKSLYKNLVTSHKSSQQIRKELRLDLQSPAAVAYGNFLKNKQTSFIRQAQNKLGYNLDVIYQYQNAFNGLAVRLTPAEAEKLSSFADVAYIERERIEQIETDIGPTHIGATSVWNGQGQSASNMGEGVIIGVIDTGINSDHDSFADIGADGYNHTNPWGAGNYVGDCATDFPEMCNDKLIGVRSYSSVTNAYLDSTIFGDNPPAANGEDYNGHGSHTASTSGGNILNDVPLLDLETDQEEGDGIDNTGFKFPQVSGVAPHANIVAYQICQPGDTGDTYSGCPGAAIIAALEDAVADGVDVINFSISGGGDPWNSPSELTFLAAQEAGIFAAVSAGNSGPTESTTEKSAPWYTIVGAATHGRSIEFSKEIGEFSGGNSNLPSFEGGSSSGAITASIVYAGDFNNPNDPNNDSAQCLKAFPQGTFNGEIVVCDRGEIARVQKAINVADGGAGGYVLANIDGGTNDIASDHYVIPGIHINNADGNLLREWLASGNGHTASISATVGEQVIGQADDTANFSSRGPNSFVNGIMTPSVTAPGVDIYAAYSDQQFGHDVNSPAPADFAFLNGTSMSAPHVAGAGAVLKSSHPTWTPDNIRSALMLTATPNVKKEDGTTPASFFDMGSGRIQVDLADKTGLIMNETAANYTAANPATGGSPKTLNIPSLSDASCVSLCNWTRTFTATEAGSWSADSIVYSQGIEISVSPAAFDLAAGESKTLTISVNALSAQRDTWLFGHLVLTSNTHPTARLPLSIKVSNGDMPDSVSFDSHRDKDSFLAKNFVAIEVDELVARSHGLVKANLAESSLLADSNNNSPYDDLTDGVNVTTYNVPSDAKRFVVEVTQSASPDLDIFVGRDTNGDGVPQENEEIALSATATALEKVDLTTPEAGNYWVIIQNWASSGEEASDTYTLATAIIENESNENLTIETSKTINQLTAFDVRFSWDMPNSMDGDLYYGAVDLGTSAENAGNMGVIPVDIKRSTNDVTIENDAQSYMQPDDIINYNVEVLANFTSEDRDYTLTATIPSGMTLDTASVTGNGVVADKTITWTVNQPALYGLSPNYSMRTNAQDASCQLPNLGQGNNGYIDLATLGVPIGNINGDTQTATYNVPANFLGTLYSSLNVAEDGFVYFSGEHSDEPWINQSLPNTKAPNNLVAPFWRDHTVARSKTSGISVAEIGEAWTIVEFDDMYNYEYIENGETAIDDVLDFEVIFDNNTGNFMFAYDNVAHNYGDELGGTVGYENVDGTSGRADIYVGTGDSIGSVESIESGLIMCYTLNLVPVEPQKFTFTAQIDNDFSGGPLDVVLAHSLNNIYTETVTDNDSTRFQVEGSPTAIVNAPSTVNEGNQLTFDGSSSMDPNGDQLTYTWEQVSGSTVSFSKNAAKIRFQAPKFSVSNNAISFQLTVDDGKGNSDSTTATVTINEVKSKSGGGGSFGWLILLLLPFLWSRQPSS